SDVSIIDLIRHARLWVGSKALTDIRHVHIHTIVMHETERGGTKLLSKDWDVIPNLLALHLNRTGWSGWGRCVNKCQFINDEVPEVFALIFIRIAHPRRFDKNAVGTNVLIFINAEGAGYFTPLTAFSRNGR